MAGRRPGGRRAGLAGAGARPGPGQLHRAGGRAGPRAADRPRVRLPHREGQGGRRAGLAARRPGAGRGGPGRPRPGRRGPGGRQRALVGRRGGGRDPGAGPGGRRPAVRRAALRRAGRAGRGAPAGAGAGSPPTSRSAAPRTRCGWRWPEPRTWRCSSALRWAGCAARWPWREACGLPCVVSSALQTSVGLAAEVALAGALPELQFACGLGTGALLAADVVAEPLRPTDGWLRRCRGALPSRSCGTRTRRTRTAPAGGTSGWPGSQFSPTDRIAYP